MKVTPDNKHQISDALRDLKQEISNNEVVHFTYLKKKKGKQTAIEIKWLIEPEKTDQ